MPKIPPAGGTDIQTKRSIDRLTGKTRRFSMASAGTKTFTVPADGSATAAINAQIMRALLSTLADKGIISLEQT